MNKNRLLHGSWKIIGSICLILLINSLVYFIFNTPSNAGTFGDIFGLSNAIFSGFAFAGIIYTILLQQEDINLQRKELRLTRKEYKTQNETLALQRFESTFFNMLDNYQSLLSYMLIESYIVHVKNDYDMYDEIRLGELQKFSNKDTFKFLHYKFTYLCQNPIYQPVRKAYYRLYDEHQDLLGHYFRNIYRIIKMIDNAEFYKGDSQEIDQKNFIERYKYTSILRSHFSVFELGLLFYNCLSDHGNSEFKPLIEKYTLLKNLPNSVLFNIDHKKLYESSAFFKSTYI